MRMGLTAYKYHDYVCCCSATTIATTLPQGYRHQHHCHDDCSSYHHQHHAFSKAKGWGRGSTLPTRKLCGERHSLSQTLNLKKFKRHRLVIRMQTHLPHGPGSALAPQHGTAPTRGSRTPGALTSSGTHRPPPWCQELVRPPLKTDQPP